MEFSVRKRVAASEVLSNPSAYAFAEKEGSSRAESASCGPESSGCEVDAEGGGLVLDSVAWRL